MIQYGINLQKIAFAPAQYTLNILNSSHFWSTRLGAANTHEEWNAFVDPNGYPISVTIGANGSALSADRFYNVALANQDSPFLYPDGPASWTLTWTGSGTWVFSHDVTGSTSTGPNTLTLDVTAHAGDTAGIGLAITATGATATVTFSGTSVSWTSNGFSSGTPVAFQSSGTLDTALTQNKVYYVVTTGANSFSISATVGGSPITFNGDGTGTQKGYGNWARNIQLVQTSQLSHVGTTLWNPDFTAKFKGLSPIRFMQMMNTYNEGLSAGNVTFSGSDVSFTQFLGTLPPFPADQTISFVPAGGTLPSPLTFRTAYYILQEGLASTGPNATPFVFKISATKGGSPITFTGGSGSIQCAACVVIGSGDIATKDYINWGQGSFETPAGLWAPPLDALCSLCNEQNADLWLNIPWFADNSWCTQAANVILANLNGNLKVYLELSNEVWSGAAYVSAFSNQLSSLFFSSGSTNQYMIYRSIEAHDLFAAVLGGSRIVRILPSQGGNAGYSAGLLESLPTDGGGPATWSNGSATKAANQFNAVCGGGYFTDSGDGQLPDAWTADADGGIAKFYQQYNTGGLLPRCNGNVVTGWIDTADITGGSNTAYTVTSSEYWDASGKHIVGGSIPATPTNGTIILVKFNAAIANTGATLQVDGGTAWPLLDRHGVACPTSAATIGNGINEGDPNIVTYVVCFTSNTTPNTGNGSANPGNSATWGWRALATFGYQSSGTIHQGLDGGAADYNTITGSYGLRALVYEGGQTFSDYGQADDPQTAYSVAANRLPEMGTTYTNYFTLNNAASSGFRDAFCHYADVQKGNSQSQWGLLESTYQPNYQNVPKYKAYMGLLGGTPTATKRKKHIVVHQ